MKWIFAAGLALALVSGSVAFSARPAQADEFVFDNCAWSPQYGPIQTIVLADGTISVVPCTPTLQDILIHTSGCLPRNLLIYTAVDGFLVPQVMQVPWNRVCRSVVIGPTNGFTTWFKSQEPWCICSIDYDAHRANQLLGLGYSREFLQVLQTQDSHFSDSSFQQLVAAIRSGAAYANIRTDMFPGGEIRGQIGP